MSINQLHYLDHNASRPVAPGVREAVLHALDHMANPSSVHQAGQYAQKIIRESRNTLARLIEADPTHIYFTGSASEANALALLGVQANHIVSCEMEHDSVYNCLKNLSHEKRTFLKGTQSGVIDLEALEQALQKAPKPCLVSLMVVNNETGVIQPLPQVVEIAKKYGAWVHTDAVQALGKIPLSFRTLDVDLMTVCAHKVGGPHGVGALIMKPGIPFQPLYFGGGQEQGLRPGTQNYPGIAGFGAALRAMDIGQFQALAPKRDAFEAQILKAAPQTIIHGKEAPRVANTSCLSMPGVPQALQLMTFDAAGFAVSAGAACSSGKIKPSRPLLAMGFDEGTAGSAIRLSFGVETPPEALEHFAQAWIKLYTRHQAA